MLRNNSSVIEQFTKKRSAKVSACRFFNNARVQIKDLIQCSKDHCGRLCSGKDVIIVHDTTEYNYWHHHKRIKEGTLGPLTNEIGLGYHAHCALVIDAQDDFPLGYSHIQMWVRKQDQPDKYERQYARLPIEQKESYRWIQTIEESNKVLQDAHSRTYIADRECDIYELWDRCGREGNNTHLIIRVRANRKLEQGGFLFDHVSSLPIAGFIEKKVRENKKKKRTRHTAKLEIRYGQVTISIAGGKKGKSVSLWVVEAKESSETVKQGEPPVHWILLTTREVDDIEKAKVVINDYCKRWCIEILFSATKTRGLNVEQSQLEHGQSLMKLGVMAFQTALKILQLKHQREAKGEKEYSMDILFDQEEEILIETLIPQWEGKTEKQKNPYKKRTLARASWLIARLGGWKGYSKESPPGVRTFSEGLKRFEDMLAMYQIMKKDVCTD
jgi:hypothetical protein